MDATLSIKYCQHSIHMKLYRYWVRGMRASGHAARPPGALLSQRAFELQDENFEPVLINSGSRPESAVFGRSARERGRSPIARIGCSRPAALLNLMPFFFASAFSSPNHPHRVELGGSDFFLRMSAQLRAIFFLVLSLRVGVGIGWLRVAENWKQQLCYCTHSGLGTTS